MSDMRLLLIGGIGGSTTRIVAQIVDKLGLYVGSNLNRSVDNLDWSFAETGDPSGRIDELMALISRPRTIRRYKRHGRPEMFDHADIETVKEFGYEVEW